MNPSPRAQRTVLSNTNYENKYTEIIEESCKFSHSILGLCNNQKEAQILLTTPKVYRYLLPRYYQMRYAIDNPNCDQLEEAYRKFSEMLGLRC